MTIKNLLNTAFLMFLAIGLLSCNKDDDNDPSGQDPEIIELELRQIPDLGIDYTLNIWLEHNNQVLDLGEVVPTSGQELSGSFNVGKEVLNSDPRFFITIEPFDDTDPGPSEWIILEAEFTSTEIKVNNSPFISSGEADMAVGSYILATPTTSSVNDEFSGVWFVDGPSNPNAGLVLPTLADNWTYEGWVNVDGNWLSTGPFADPGGSDDRSTYSSSERPPFPFPGEDFVNALPGIPIPDLRGKNVYITIEPVDNNSLPFYLGLMEDNIDNNAPARMAQDMINMGSDGWMKASISRK